MNSVESVTGILNGKSASTNQLPAGEFGRYAAINDTYEALTGEKLLIIGKNWKYLTNGNVTVGFKITPAP